MYLRIHYVKGILIRVMKEELLIKSIYFTPR